MENDLTKLLRDPTFALVNSPQDIMRLAADEIEALRKECVTWIEASQQAIKASEQNLARAKQAERELNAVEKALDAAGQYELKGSAATQADRIADLYSDYERRHYDALNLRDERDAALAEVARLREALQRNPHTFGRFILAELEGRKEPK